MVRDLVWSIRWSPRRGLADFTLDTIAIDNLDEQGGALRGLAASSATGLMSGAGVPAGSIG